MAERKSINFPELIGYALSDNCFTGNPVSGQWKRSNIGQFFSNVGMSVAIGGASTTFAGNIVAVGNVSGVGGTFTGNISAVDGTFTGNVSAVGGTFTGNASITGDINIGGAVGNSQVIIESGGAAANLAQIVFKRGGTDRWTVGTRGFADANYQIFNSGLGTAAIAIGSVDNGVQFSSLTGSGTQDVHADANGILVRIGSDEKTKKDIEPLGVGLDFVLAASKHSISFNYKNEGLNSDQKYWGFGARAVVKEFGKNPVFREKEGIYAWDNKNMIAPAYNAIAELTKRIEILEAKT